MQIQKISIVITLCRTVLLSHPRLQDFPKRIPQAGSGPEHLQVQDGL